MKINYLEMSDIRDIIDEFKQNQNFEGAIKQNTFFNFWGKIVGKKFANNSKCVKLNSDGILTVACKNSFISNELMMFKDEILRKSNIYANPLDIEIKDITFSHKIWQEQAQKEKEEPAEEAAPPPKKIPDEILDTIELAPEETEIIKNAIDDITFADADEKVKMYNAIIKNLKEQKFRNQKNV